MSESNKQNGVLKAAAIGVLALTLSGEGKVGENKTLSLATSKESKPITTIIPDKPTQTPTPQVINEPKIISTPIPKVTISPTPESTPINGLTQKIEIAKPLVQFEDYAGKFTNAKAGVKEFNSKISETLYPSQKISLLADDLITIDKKFGYVNTSETFGSGVCWAAVALDEALLGSNIVLPDHTEIPIVLFKKGWRTIHYVNYYTYGGVDINGKKFSYGGATIYRNQTASGKFLTNGSIDYVFEVNPELTKYGIEGISIHMGFNEDTKTIQAQIVLVDAPKNIGLKFTQFHSAAEINQAYKDRTIE